VVGASILPFSVDPNWQCVYFWLAQERFCPGWPAGSLTWSDFGGSMSAEDDGDPIRCACREFNEESMSVIPVTPEEATKGDDALHAEGARGSTDGIVEMLGSACYTLRITTVISEGHIYVTYVKQVPWRPESQELFTSTFNKARSNDLPGTHPAVSASGNAHDAFLEKTSVRLFSILQLRRMVDYTTDCGSRAASGGERLRWGFHRRLSLILDQFPHDGQLANCGRAGGGVKLSMETYQRLPLPDDGSDDNDEETPGAPPAPVEHAVTTGGC
jgi:hypothetical protein